MACVCYMYIVSEGDVGWIKPASFEKLSPKLGVRTIVVVYYLLLYLLPPPRSSDCAAHEDITTDLNPD